MSLVQSTPYAELEVGQTARYSKRIDDREIQLFAELSGDRNPIHLDDDYAASTAFKGRIAHGMISGALISAAVACTIPGPGTVYLGQTMSFTQVVRPGDELTVELEILEKLPKSRVRIATRVFNQNREQVVDGVAEVLAPKRKREVELSALPAIRIG